MAGWEEQRENVVQLLYDRKNMPGGKASGIKDFSEMGAIGREHWPLSGEQIKRGFGSPNRNDPRADTDEVPQEEWLTTLRVQAHRRLEEELEWLRENSPLLYAAILRVFDEDLGGDRDYEILAAKAARGDARARAAKARIAELAGQAKRMQRSGQRAQAKKIRDKLQREVRAAARPRSTIEKCDAGIDVIAARLMGEDLVVEYARRMTRMEESAMEEMNARILDEYWELLSRSKGTKKNAAQVVCRKHGISERTLFRIEQNHREEMGEEPRAPGRPKKED